MVLAFAYHTFDAAVDDEHGTSAAGGHAAVQGGAVEGYATSCGLANGVLLGMDSTDTMGGDTSVGFDGATEEVSHFVAVGKAGGGAHIAGDEQLAVLDYDASGATAVACGTLGGGVGQFHEVLIP